MSTLQKFDPSRTIYFRGFSGIQCPAAIHHASATGFTLSQVFREADDFSVLVIYDVDDFYGHPILKPLPDIGTSANGNLKGIVLEFDLTADPTVFATLDRPKFPTIDFPFLDYVLLDGTTGRIDLSLGNIQSTINGGALSPAVRANTNPTTITIGSLTSASASVTVSLSGSSSVGDTLTLWYQNNAFSYTPGFGDTSATVAHALAAAITSNNGAGWGGYLYGLSATASVAAITITVSHPGVDGNLNAFYWTSTNTSRTKFTTANPIYCSGGNSSATYHVKLDFSALGIDNARQLWLTFAPVIPYATPALLDSIHGVQGDVVFANWHISADPNSKAPLKVAGPGSVRIEESDAGVTQTGSWALSNGGWFSQGYAVVSSNVGDSITVTYWSQATHDLYLGTSLYSDRGTFAVTVDGAAQAALNMALAATTAIATRRKIASSIAPGQHTVVLTISGAGYCYFDFLEAAVAGDVPAALGPWTDRGISTDFDTQHGYQLSPARLLWMMDQLGFRGDIDHYMGVFWWNNRQAVGRVLGTVTIDFAALPALTAGTAIISLTIGGTPVSKNVESGETTATWALHFALAINEIFTGVFAAAAGTVLTMTARGPVTATSSAFAFSFAAQHNNGAGNVTITPAGIGFTSSLIAAGTWQIDPGQADITYPAQQWHADYFAQIAARGMKVAAAFSMELVYPPDSNSVGNVWVARSSNAIAITTDTGFGSYFSSQCAPMAASFLAFQKQAYLQLAGLMSTAGLTPYLQFGEFLWWYFSSWWRQPIGYVAILSYVRLGFASPHGMGAGDSVRVESCASIPSINGTWTVVDVPDPTHVDITAPYTGGTWAGDGIASGGSMAYYDLETEAAARTALARDLHRFTFPDDDPTVNGGADATFLANRLAAHVAAIISYVQAAYPGTVFEVLWPGDVNGQNVTPVSKVGGELNHAVNLPVSWQSSVAAPFSVLKVEQLAFATTDRNMDLVKSGLDSVTGWGWAQANLRYLYPVNGSSIAQWKELALARRYAFPNYNVFAIDQICLFGWTVVEPVESGFRAD